MKNKRLIEKKKHHYVWANYLRNWSKDETNICYISQTGKLSCDSVLGLACKKHFYKSQIISPEHFEIIKQILISSPLDAQLINRRFLENYLEIQRREIAMKALNVSDKTAIDTLNALKGNFIEDLHCRYELDANPIMQSLCAGNMDVLDDPQNLMKITAFIGHQMSRTRAWKEAMLACCPEPLKPHMEGCWWFVSHMFGVNIGVNLRNQEPRSTVCLLRNTSTENFITADHPIANVHQSCGGDLSIPPEEADFYYPISPRYALMLNASDRFQPGVSDVDAHFVQSMNRKISEGAEATIFGLSKEDIQPYRGILGQRLKRVKEHHRRR